MHFQCAEGPLPAKKPLNRSSPAKFAQPPENSEGCCDEQFGSEPKRERRGYTQASVRSEQRRISAKDPSPEGFLRRRPSEEPRSVRRWSSVARPNRGDRTSCGGTAPLGVFRRALIGEMPEEISLQWQCLYVSLKCERCAKRGGRSCKQDSGRSRPDAAIQRPRNRNLDHSCTAHDRIIDQPWLPAKARSDGTSSISRGRRTTELTDRRWNRLLPANPASDCQGHPKRKRGAAARVAPLSRPPFVHGSTRSRVAQRIRRVFSRASSLSSFRSKTSRTSCNCSSPYTSARYEGKSVASLLHLGRCRSKTAASGRRGRGVRHQRRAA
jgi:hypothetical protein